MTSPTISTYIRKKLREEDFFPGVLGLFTNPFYFARKGLAANLTSLGGSVSGRLLDVGCGRKPYKKIFNVKEYVGLDIEQSGHDHKFEEIDVYYDGLTIPFDSEVFDSVISNQVLEHVFNPSQHLSEIYRVLKPNGHLLISVPFVWDEHEQPFDYARYSSFGLASLLGKQGFQIVEHRKSVNDIRVIFQMFNAYLFKIINRHTRGYFRLLVTVIFCAPVNILGVLLSRVLPSNNDLYLDNIVVAAKREINH